MVSLSALRSMFLPFQHVGLSVFLLVCAHQVPVTCPPRPRSSPSKSATRAILQNSPSCTACTAAETPSAALLAATRSVESQLSAPSLVPPPPVLWAAVRLMPHSHPSSSRSGQHHPDPDRVLGQGQRAAFVDLAFRSRGGVAFPCFLFLSLSLFSLDLLLWLRWYLTAHPPLSIVAEMRLWGLPARDTSRLPFCGHVWFCVSSLA